MRWRRVTDVVFPGVARVPRRKRAHDAIACDLRNELLTLPDGELLGVVDAGHRAPFRRHDHGTSDNGAREGAPSDFVDSGDQRTMLCAEITLDRAPAHGCFSSQDC